MNVRALGVLLKVELHGRRCEDDQEHCQQNEVETFVSEYGPKAPQAVR
jgi:hypothetical protein